MGKTRKPSFSGSWYPANASECEKEIQAFLKEPGFQAIPQADYIGGIVPHAGWYFSGSLACRVISALKKSGHATATGCCRCFRHAHAPKFNAMYYDRRRMENTIR